MPSIHLNYHMIPPGWNSTNTDQNC